MVYNFSAGPSVLPHEALLRAQEELLDWHGSGVSVMEMSHRSPMFAEIFSEAKEKLRLALRVPDTHEILFLQGGATLQFASVPMNLIKNGCADYAVTGNFSAIAAEEAKKYGKVFLACNTAPEHDRIPAQNELRFTDGAEYFYYCANNTVYGTEWPYVPEAPSPLVCDMSSDILSKPVDVLKYGLILAGAQKNMAPAGLTLVIVDRSLVGNELACTPKVMRYRTLVEHDSMLNTPPCWSIYMLGLVLDWLETQGGVAGMEQRKRERAAMLYDLLDNSDFYTPHAKQGSRSDMNVTFRTPSPELDAAFVRGAEKRGLINLKGHKAAGGLRASLYNAMPTEGVAALVDYMKTFEGENKCRR